MRLLRKIAFPIALLYGMAVHFRNALYDWGWLKSQAFETPLISIGNLSLGGTGKTPMIEWLVEQAGEQYDLAVLSRGYGRSTRGMLEAVPESTALEIGDEPKQLHRRFPEITLIVDADRKRAVEWLEQNKHPELIILDDAHQHRRIKPSHAVLLTPYARPFTRDFFLPTGTLRDSRSQAKRASCIIVTKCPASLSETEKNGLIREVQTRPDQPVYFTSLEYDPMLQGTVPKPMTDLQSEPFTLVTGIANPKPLLDYLTAAGYRFEHLKFGDHHRFTQREIQKLATKKTLVLTEKDYARLGDALPNALCIRMRHRFLGSDGNAFLKQLGLRIPSAST